MGRVTGAHGVKGQLRIGIDADDADTLRGVTRLVLGGERPDAPDSSYEVESLTAGRPGELRVTLRGVRTRDAAEALRGREVFADKGELAPLEEGEVYGHELIGCALEDEGGAPLGRVRDIWETGAPDVLIVDGDDGREHLIPAALLREVDVTGRRAVVELIPGLLDPEGAADPESSRDPEEAG
ncbi:MAG: ribosome maturation factor RimM [Myxococcota bacterium]|nr:ribosome maturation factor RimM [Myxococcota bacterium]